MKTQILVYILSIACYLFSGCAASDGDAAVLTQVAVVALLEQNPEEIPFAIAFLDGISGDMSLEDEIAGWEKAFPGHGATTTMLAQYLRGHVRPQWRDEAKKLSAILRTIGGK